ncbi:hypothetical protein SESBI_07041 [Sesbania bispinosa]|nr:hypothetical protein SESBI_07041 [Sesbania bispinosa]
MSWQGTSSGAKLSKHKTTCTDSSPEYPYQVCKNANRKLEELDSRRGSFNYWRVVLYSAKDKEHGFSGTVIVEAIYLTLVIFSVDDVGRMAN